ncbi:type I-E CRISPR-associated endonuclease Cas1e [Catenulispora yoronensis]|uniref:CRISPR-associated endonuclease Cas1 n=1 Tax=Catenulispora yoronensis TaxID=450799 RepID=A0ABP5GTZ6_9ACTN
MTTAAGPPGQPSTQAARRKIAVPTAAMIPRIGDSLSFLYLDMMRIIQDDTGLIAFPAQPAPNRRLRIPTAALSCLLLGPGTSITVPALATLARHGTTVVCTGTAAVRTYAGIVGPGQSSRWLEAQAAAWADPEQRLAVAARMYALRFGQDLPPGVTLAQMRGLEGQRMKATYKILATQHRVGRFKRTYDPDDWDSQDPVNLALSAANTCLYGIAHAAILALGCTPGLGFVHTGTTHAFVYDIADLYKAELTLPLAFSLNASENPEADARRAFRSKLRLFRLMPRIVRDIQNLLLPDQTPLAAADGDDTDLDDIQLVHLWDPDDGTVAGGTNYGYGQPWQT